MKPACNKSLQTLMLCARHGCAADRAELILRRDAMTKTILPNLKQPAARRRAESLLARIEAIVGKGKA